MSRQPLTNLRALQIRRDVRRYGYLGAYARDTDRRVRMDPQASVGGYWDLIGRLQCEYLVEYGLRPSASFLDVGCGTLRGGHRLIEYLDADRYTGVDMSREAIRFAREFVAATPSLRAKRPQLLHDAAGQGDYRELGLATFDLLFAHSVFSHIPSDLLTTIFANLRRHMGPDSEMLFTIIPSNRDGFQAVNEKDFAYSLEYLQSRLAAVGLSVNEAMEYDHPRGQVMLVARRIG